MASIELRSEDGFALIEDKIRSLTDDIGTMIERKEISEEAAKALLNDFKIIAGICSDYKKEEVKKNIISF